MNEGRVCLHTLRIPVRWADLDALGHVNNATYFTYFEQARVSWFESINATGAVLTGAALGPVLAHAACTFHQPVVYPASLEVRLYGGQVGRSSVETYYELRDAAQSETLYATGNARLVWVDRATGRSTPIPAAIRELLPHAAG